MSLEPGAKRPAARPPLWDLLPMFATAPGRPTGADTALCRFPQAPFSFSLDCLRNGPQPARARGVGAAEENLCVFAKIFRSVPWRARTVLEPGIEGKGGGRSLSTLPPLALIHWLPLLTHSFSPQSGQRVFVWPFALLALPPCRSGRSPSAPVLPWLRPL
jgi:hypothetical protein